MPLEYTQTQLQILGIEAEPSEHSGEKRPKPNDQTYRAVFAELYGTEALEKLANPDARKNLETPTEYIEREKPIVHCETSGLQVWGDAFRAAYFMKFKERVLKQGKSFLTVEIDMRLLKEFNDIYGEDVADEALLQFTNELLAHLLALVGVEADAEFYLYKEHPGGDDYSLGISGSTELLKRIMTELPALLDGKFQTFTRKCKPSKGGHFVTKELAAESGMSLIEGSKDPREEFSVLAKQYKFPLDKLQAFSTRHHPESWNILHNTIVVQKHVAFANLESSKLQQIFKELKVADDIALQEIAGSDNEVRIDVGSYTRTLNFLRSMNIETLTSDEILNSLSDLYDLLYQPISLKVDAGSNMRNAKNKFITKLEKAKEEVAASFGTRRLNPTGLYYVTNITSNCTRVAVKIKHNIPLTPRELAFLCLVPEETAVELETYIISLISRQLKLKAQEPESTGQSSQYGLKHVLAGQQELDPIRQRTLTEITEYVDSLPVPEIPEIARKFLDFLQ